MRKRFLEIAERVAQVPVRDSQAAAPQTGQMPAVVRVSLVPADSPTKQHPARLAPSPRGC
jgi:hypothetical protein